MARATTISPDLATAGTDARVRDGVAPRVAIEVRGVTKVYGTRKILDAIQLDVFEGETLVVMGGSGSGKSTLLRLMIGNVIPDGGDVVGLGKSLSKMTDAELVQYRKQI